MKRFSRFVTAVALAFAAAAATPVAANAAADDVGTQVNYCSSGLGPGSDSITIGCTRKFWIWWAEAEVCTIACTWRAYGTWQSSGNTITMYMDVPGYFSGRYRVSWA